jgi:hypothetical protein
MKAVCSLALTLFATGTLTLVVSAQQPPPPAGFAFSGSGEGMPGPMVWQMQMQKQSQAAELAQKYVKSEKESEKKEIRQKLTETLNQMFDEHMEQQQKELEDLEKQIAELRTVMKKRAGAKATIVDRRIEQMIQDAEGLGWNAPGGPHMNHMPGFGFYSQFGSKASGTRKADESGKKKEQRERE